MSMETCLCMNMQIFIAENRQWESLMVFLLLHCILRMTQGFSERKVLKWWWEDACQGLLPLSHVGCLSSECISVFKKMHIIFRIFIDII